MVLQAESVTVEKQRRRLLDNINMHCAAGEMLAICGPNGAGKSTLLRVLAGDQHSSGRVDINGRPLPGYNAASLAMVRAVMPQKVELPFSFAVRDVILMGLRHGLPAASRQQLLDEVSGRFDLAGLLALDYQHLSGGQQQRVQLARVVIQLLQPGLRGQPRYLLLDECSSAMDVAMQQRMFASLRQLLADRIGVIAVMHDLNLASRFADRLLMLRDGRLVLSGSASEVIRPCHLQDVFALEAQVIRHPQHGCPVVL
ncbi:MAG TPA: heme ABC transporter ATP-binding protein [Pseudomonadales bacterium]